MAEQQPQLHLWGVTTSRTLRALWALHDAGFEVWFKGGTSLSKVHAARTSSARSRAPVARSSQRFPRAPSSAS
jgi:hypothetical protein